MDQDKEPKPGDLIEISRAGYMHWAIYVGDGYVIHVTASGEGSSGGSSGSSGEDSKAIVKKETLQDVAGDDQYCINNHLEDQYEPRPIDDILQEAESFVGKEFPYDVLSHNCEHFVTLLKYGKPHSHQAKIAVGLLVGLLGLAGIFGIIAVAASRRKQSESVNVENEEINEEMENEEKL